MKSALETHVLDQLFTSARSVNVWTDSPLTQKDMEAIYDLMKMGPTSANCSPARLVFVTSDAAKARLTPHVMEGNIAKVQGAPATAIIGYDMDFASRMPQLFPHNLDAKNWFSDPQVQYDTAFRNSTLQGAYFMMAARALGFDCGPMSGFDRAGVDAEFFAGTNVKSNFICAIGRGSEEGIFPRSPRLDFADAAQVL